jgi:signal recognition particle subunit SRP54
LKNDYVLIDTAGRLHIDEALMDELKQIKEIAQPNEILLVVDAMPSNLVITTPVIPNCSLKLCATLTASCPVQLGITGVVITKLDGDTRGGAALSIRAVTGAPIKFIEIKAVFLHLASKFFSFLFIVILLCFFDQSQH